MDKSRYLRLGTKFNMVSTSQQMMNNSEGCDLGHVTPSILWDTSIFFEQVVVGISNLVHTLNNDHGECYPTDGKLTPKTHSKIQVKNRRTTDSTKTHFT